MRLPLLCLNSVSTQVWNSGTPKTTHLHLIFRIAPFMGESLETPGLRVDSQVSTPNHFVVPQLLVDMAQLEFESLPPAISTSNRYDDGHAWDFECSRETVVNRQNSKYCDGKGAFRSHPHRANSTTNRLGQFGSSRSWNTCRNHVEYTVPFEKWCCASNLTWNRRTTRNKYQRKIFASLMNLTLHPTCVPAESVDSQIFPCILSLTFSWQLGEGVQIWIGSALPTFATWRPSKRVTSRIMCSLDSYLFFLSKVALWLLSTTHQLSPLLSIFC